MPAPTNIHPKTRHDPSGHSLASDHSTVGNHAKSVAGDPLAPTTRRPKSMIVALALSSAPDQVCGASHNVSVGGIFSSQPIMSEPLTQAGNVGWDELRLWAEILEDIQKTRKANYNRIGEDAAGRSYRINVDPEQYRPFLAMIDNAEKEAWSQLVGCYRRVVPTEIIDWQRTTHGIGEKRLARILGALGDPCIATPHRWEGAGSDRVLIQGEPYLRTVGQLWAYCGLGDPTRRRSSGMTADQLFACGSTFLKSQIWNMTQEIIRTGGDRTIYDEAKAKYVDRLHDRDCPPCHAKAGQPWKPAHKDQAAKRVFGKHLLKQLWLVRREGLASDQQPPDFHTLLVVG